MPDFSHEINYPRPLVGVDEVGRGPLAGPVVAGAVIIPDNVRGKPEIGMIRSSKELTKKKREIIHDFLVKTCPFAIGMASVQEIDAMNILQATMLAMRRAIQNLANLNHAPAHILVDGNKCPQSAYPESFLVRGDSKNITIAAASVIAKVVRDSIMDDLSESYPHYAWQKNAGYGTKQHLDAIHTYGITPHHRKSFAPIRNFINIDNGIT